MKIIHDFGYFPNGISVHEIISILGDEIQSHDAYIGLEYDSSNDEQPRIILYSEF